MGEKDFCTIANEVVKKEIDDINTEITEKESEIYEYINAKTNMTSKSNIVIINPQHTEDFMLKTNKCRVTNNLVYVFIQIEFLREFSDKQFVIGNLDATKISLPESISFVGSVKLIGQINPSGEIAVNDVTTIGNYNAGDKISVFGFYYITV